MELLSLSLSGRTKHSNFFNLTKRFIEYGMVNVVVFMTCHVGTSV